MPTTHADYRIPQILHALGSMTYSPPLEEHIRARKEIAAGSSWELQLRGCSIWCVEALRREIERQHPDARLNAILIDFFLYDAMKDLERDAAARRRGARSGGAEVVVEEEQEEQEGEEEGAEELVPRRRRQRQRQQQPVLETTDEAREIVPHHRTRTIWY